MRTDLVLDKDDLIKMIQTSFGQLAKDIALTSITANVVLTNGENADFKEVIFSLEPEIKVK